MDNFKKINVNMATKYDFNVPNIVKLRDRSKVHKMINRYARRKLKENIKSEVEKTMNNYKETLEYYSRK